MKMQVLCLLILLLVSCNDTATHQQFDIKKAEGIWTLFEIRQKDGTVITGDLTLADLFAPYKGSFKLNEDHTYSSLVWSDQTDFSNIQPTGIWAYDESTNKLSFSGEWPRDFDVIRFTSSELW